MIESLWRRPAPLLVLLLAAALRLHEAGAQSLWHDEGNSVVQAGRSLADIALHAARDIHPPGYYWLLHVWARLTGTSELALRMLSVLAGILTAALLYAAGRRLFGRTAGLVASLLLALSGFSIWYAQETRMYALLALWGAAATLLLAALPDRPGWRRVTALALVNAAGLWTHYAWPFVMLAQGAVALLWLESAGLRTAVTRRRWLSFAGAMGLAILLFLPWLPTALASVTGWPATGGPVTSARALGGIFARLVTGPSHDSLAPEWQALVAGGALVLALAGLMPTRRALWRSWLPLVWTLVPVALFLALGLYRGANLKFLLPAQAGFALWAGRGCAWLWSCPLPALRLLALLAAATLVTGMALALGPLGHEAAYQRADYRGLVADISPMLAAEDLVVLNAPNQLEVFSYYYRGAASLLPIPPGTGPVDAASLARMRELVAGARQVYALYWGDTERDPERVVERALNELAHEAGSRWYGDVRLVHYLSPRPLPVVAGSGARFGADIRLLRHARNAPALAPGEALLLQLDWSSDSALATRYKVFLQLLDDAGRLVAQHDSEPGGGLAPATSWLPGATVQDRRALVLPQWLPAGRYSLIVGLYTVGDPGRRLPVGDADHLVVGTLEITGEND